MFGVVISNIWWGDEGDMREVQSSENSSMLPYKDWVLLF
jgi:hypothetical protein